MSEMPETNRSEPTNHAAPLTPRRLLHSTLTVMAGFTITKLVSLGQVVIIADRFGARADYDTFVQANIAPEQLVKFLAVGALSVAFIPVFSGLLNRKDSAGAWRLASQVFNTLLFVTLALSVLIGITAPLLVERVIAPGFNDAEVAQTVSLLRILMISTVIFTLSSLLTGVLTGHNHFFLPVLAPIFQDLGLLFGAIVFTGPFGIHGLAWGVVLGAVLHFAIQVPGLFMFKARWTFSLGWSDPKLREVVRLMIPRMLASGVFAINFIAIGNIASRLGEGAPSAFSWGLRIMDIPEALIGTALGFVIFPTLSALTELGKTEERSKVASEAVRFILVATIPAAAGMLLIGKPAVSILFAEAYEAALVYAAVQVFAFAMILQSVHEIVARAFYADKDTMTPLLISIAGMVGNIAVLIVGFSIYNNVDGIPLAGPLGVGILPMGYLAAFIVELTLLTIVLRKRWGGLHEQRVFRAALRTVAATLLMAVPVFAVDTVLSQQLSTDDFVGQIYMDDVVLIPAESEPEIFQDFENGPAGWVLSKAEAMAGGTAVEILDDIDFSQIAATSDDDQDTIDVSNTTHVLALQTDLHGAYRLAGVYVPFAAGVDWSAYDSVSMRVFIPTTAENFRATLYVDTGEDEEETAIVTEVLTPGEWTTVTADLNDTDDLNDVREFGVRVGTYTGRLAGIIRAGIGGILGLVFFLIGAWVFDLQEVKQAPQMFRRQRNTNPAV